MLCLQWAKQELTAFVVSLGGVLGCSLSRDFIVLLGDLNSHMDREEDTWVWVIQLQQILKTQSGGGRLAQAVFTHAAELLTRRRGIINWLRGLGEAPEPDQHRGVSRLMGCLT